MRNLSKKKASRCRVTSKVSSRNAAVLEEVLFIYYFCA